MNKRSTHNAMTKAVVPWLDMKMIDKVNRALDREDPSSRLLSMLTAPLARADKRLSLGVTRTGHRRTNHDLMSASVTGYTIAGYGGTLAGQSSLSMRPFRSSGSG